MNYRTDIYYLETDDLGKTWRTASGEVVTLPVRNKDSVSRVLVAEPGQNVYIKGVRFDTEGRPYILYLTSRGPDCGPQNDPRAWKVIHWTGTSWRVVETGITGDNNYDFGTLRLESSDTWRILAATGKGPQAWNPGGELELWRTTDAGCTWGLEKRVTERSLRNMNYAREPVDAQPGFRAFWADGDGRDISESRLYYCDETYSVREMTFQK